MIVFTSLLYSIIIKLFNGEKLKDMINVMQIGISIIFIITYQVVGRSVNLFDSTIVYESELWNIFIPPMWFASNFKVVLSSSIDTMNMVLSILSILVPIFCFIVYLKNIYRFENNLNKLNDNTYRKTKKPITLTLKVSRVVCRNKEERAFFNFICNILSKDRELKMRTYPSLALSVFLPYMMVFTLYEDISLETGCITIYLGLVMMIGFLSIIKYSNNAKASWIYNIAPVKDNSNIFKGTIKAVIYKIYLPVLLLFSIGFIVIFKFLAIKHLIIITLGLILSTIIIVRIENTLPFSMNYSIAAMSSNMGKLLVYMIIIGVTALVHYLVSGNIMLTYSYIVMLVALIVISWSKLLNIDIR